MNTHTCLVNLVCELISAVTTSVSCLLSCILFFNQHTPLYTTHMACEYKYNRTKYRGKRSMSSDCYTLDDRANTPQTQAKDDEDTWSWGSGPNLTISRHTATRRSDVIVMLDDKGSNSGGKTNKSSGSGSRMTRLSRFVGRFNLFFKTSGGRDSVTRNNQVSQDPPLGGHGIYLGLDGPACLIDDNPNRIFQVSRMFWCLFVCLWYEFWYPNKV